MSAAQSLLQPFVVGGLAIRNRVARSATAEGMADENGAPTDSLVSLYGALGHGHVGLVITSHTYVMPNGIAHEKQLSMCNDEVGETHRRIVDAVHAGGSKICIQLAHGGKTSPSEDRVGPSDIEIKNMGKCREATEADLDAIVAAFAAAAKRSAHAGYDMVMVHSAHGYLLSEFLCPAYNKRTDAYGGSLENRARLLLRVVRAVREATSEKIPVSVKLNTQDFVDGGMSLEESSQVVRMLADAGVCMVEASGAVWTSRPPTTTVRKSKDYAGPYHVEGAAAWKKALAGRDVVVCHVGGVRSAVDAQKLIDDGVCDMVSLSRPFICEPGLVAKWEQDFTAKADCLSCNYCFSVFTKGVKCPTGEKKRAAEAAACKC